MYAMFVWMLALTAVVGWTGWTVHKIHREALHTHRKAILQFVDDAKKAHKELEEEQKAHLREIALLASRLHSVEQSATNLVKITGQILTDMKTIFVREQAKVESQKVS